MKIGSFRMALVLWLALVPRLASALPDDVPISDVELRSDGVVVFAYSIRIDGRLRVAFSTRTSPDDPATESPMQLVPPLVGLADDAVPADLRFSRDGRYLIGTLQAGLEEPVPGFQRAIARAFIFDTLHPELPAVRIDPLPGTSLIPASPDATIPPELAPVVEDGLTGLVDIADTGVAIGESGAFIPPVPFVASRGIVARSDGETMELRVPALDATDGQRFIPRLTTADGTGLVGSVATQGRSPVFAAFLADGELVPLAPVAEFPPSPQVVERDARADDGRIIADSVAVLVYDSARAAPTTYRPLPTDTFARAGREGLSSARAFIGEITRAARADSPFIREVVLFEVLEATEVEAALPGPDEVPADQVAGIPIFRREGASVFDANDAGFKFFVPGDRPGAMLRGSLLRLELAQVAGSGFDAGIPLRECLLGDDGIRAVILCQGIPDGVPPRPRARLVAHANLVVTNAPDADGDGDGIGDADDNCPFTPNADQRDVGGRARRAHRGPVAPDGIGDACQCGDVSGDGLVTVEDARLVARAAITRRFDRLPASEKCDVGGAPGCSLRDAILIRRSLRPRAHPLPQTCPAARAARE